MKKLISVVSAATLLSTLAFAQDPTPSPTPIQLRVIAETLQPIMFQRPVRVEPIMLNPAQANVLMTAVANTGLMAMPAGYSLTQIEDIRIQVITSGSNAGYVVLSPMLTPAPLPTPTPTPVPTPIVAQ